MAGMVLVGTDTITEMKHRLRPTHTKVFPTKSDKEGDRDNTEATPVKNVLPSQFVALQKRQPVASPPAPSIVSGPPKTVSRRTSVYIIQTVTGVEVTIGNCFPGVGETLPDAEGEG